MTTSSTGYIERPTRAVDDVLNAAELATLQIGETITEGVKNLAWLLVEKLAVSPQFRQINLDTYPERNAFNCEDQTSESCPDKVYPSSTWPALA